MDNLKIKQINRSLAENYIEIVLRKPLTKELLDETKTYTLEEQKNNRSLDANSYMWVLIGKMAKKLRRGQNELYVELLGEYGVSFMLSVEKSKAREVLKSIKYYELMEKEGEVNGKTFIHFKYIVGSSQYDTKQMAHFIDMIVQECKGLDIETMTPSELMSLKANWKGEK